MKNIDYKKLRRFDIGKTVVNNSYLTNLDLVSGEITQPVTSALDINNQLSGQNTKDAVTGGLNLVKTALDTGLINQIGNLFSPVSNLTNVGTLANGMQATTYAGNLGQGVSQLGGFASTTGAGLGNTSAAVNTAETAASTGSSAASTATSYLPYVGIAMGAYNMLNTTLDANKTVDSNMINSMSGKGVLYINGVPYSTNNGFDAAGLRSYVKKLNTGNFINTVIGDTSMGASIGSLFPGYGTLIGTAAGLIGGIGRGLANIFVRNKNANQAISAATKAYEGANRQSFSEARTKSTQQADKGLSPNHTNPNALVQGGEPIVGIDKITGDIKSATVFPITDKHPERVDNIPVRLDQGDTTHGILGNKIDPLTGERLAVEGRPYAAMVNSDNPIEKLIGKDGLKYLLDLQDLLPKTLDSVYADKGKEPDLDKLTWVPKKKIEEYKMNRAQKGNMLKYTKTLPKFKFGKTTDWLSIAPGAAGMLTGLGLLLSYSKSKPEAMESYAPNVYANKALNMMPLYYDPTNLLKAMNDITRLSMYNINRSTNGGNRMSMMSNLFGNRMKNYAAIYDNAEKQTNLYKKDYADLAYKIGESDASRRQRSNELYNDQYAKSVATKRKGIETGAASIVSNFDKIFNNLQNNYWTNKNIGLYQLNLNKDAYKTYYDIIKDNGLDDNLKQQLRKTLGIV